MRRLASQTPKALTAQVLAEWVPIFQAGRAAERTLTGNEGIDPDLLTPTQLRQLHIDIREGERAKEHLVLVGWGLVQTLAKSAHRAGLSRGSTIPYEDLFQDGIIGYLKGLESYDPTKGSKSPTHHLSGFITTYIRRNSEPETLLRVGREELALFRRIRAIHGRLEGELGRPPTPTEIVHASTEPWKTNAQMARKSAEGGTPRAVTEQQVLEERAFYAIHLDPVRLSESPDGGSATNRRDYQSGEKVADERGRRAGLSHILDATMHRIGMPAQQREVIARQWGLPPFEDEATESEIAAAMDLPRGTVTKIASAFRELMTTPGSALHTILLSYDPDDITALGLTWVLQSLGATPPTTAPPQPPKVLTQQLTETTDQLPPPPANTRPGEVVAQFLCPLERSDFTRHYRRARDIPRATTCPSCGQPATMIRSSQKIPRRRPGTGPVPLVGGL